MIIAFKEFLNRGSFELGLVLKHLLRIGIFPLAVRVFCVEILFIERRNEWCWHSLFAKCLPVEVSEPIVLFQNLWPLLSKSISWLSLNQSVDKISSLKRPTVGNLVLMDFDLLG